MSRLRSEGTGGRVGQVGAPKRITGLLPAERAGRETQERHRLKSFVVVELLTSPRWLYRHCRDLGPGDRGAGLCSGFFRWQAGVPVHREKAPPGHAAGSI